MKLSISNIGWEPSVDTPVYQLMQNYGFCGIEIAPTVWVPELPYETEQVKAAEQIAQDLKQNYGFSVSSMQSIWFGRTEKLFASGEEKSALLEYTKKAIDYAAAVNCHNLVFGCPRNRNISSEWNLSQRQIDAVAISFFQELGEYAHEKGTVLSMEANPPIYNTNYINTTKQALELVHKVNSKGFLLNLDLGTMICNEEQIAMLENEVDYINHVHISEPGLKAIEKRRLHEELAELLRRKSYGNFISIEVGKSSPDELAQMMKYISEVFHG